LELSRILNDAQKVAAEFGLRVAELDRTLHTATLRIYVEADIYFQIYANEEKDKLNLALIFHHERIYGHDKEGGRYHMHPFENPEAISSQIWKNLYGILC